MKGKFPLLFLFSLLYSQFGEIPDWVKKRPFDPDYFIGIVSVPVDAGGDAEIEAQNKAISQISSSIRTQVMSKTISVFRQKGVFDVKQDFIEENLTFTVNTLEGLENIDNAIVGNDYWTYWRLPKDAYKKSEKESIEAAKANYIKYLNTNEREISQRLRLLVTALNNLMRFYNADVKQQDIIYNELSKVVENLDLKPNYDFIRAEYDNPLSREITITVTGELEEYNVFSEVRKMPIKNVPVTFSFTRGSGVFKFTTRPTDDFGQSTTSIKKITDVRPGQEISAKIDLKRLKPSFQAFPVFPILDSVLDEITGLNQVIIQLEVSRVKVDEVAVYVSGEGINRFEITAINDAFQDFFEENKNFHVRSRDEANKEIQKQNLDPLEACTSYECRVAIITVLKIEKLILVNLNYDASKRKLRVKMTLDNVKIDRSETVLRDTKDIPRGTDLPEYIEKEFMQDWVDQFVEEANPSRIEIVSAPGQRISMHIEGQPTNATRQLPYYASLPTGTYNMTFTSSGYEKKDTTFNVIVGAPIYTSITLRKKSPVKALLLSMAFPGQGQLYSYDTSHPERKRRGKFFRWGAILAGAVTSYSYYSFIQSQNQYSETNLQYRQQTDVTGIEVHRQRAMDQNRAMKNQYALFQSAAVGTALYWLFNMAEAYVNLPE